MPLPKPSIPPAAEPNRRVFDPWNSVGAGHQRPETKGPGGWRESRAMKMNSQLVAGNSGGKRIHDTVGEGSLDFDEKRRVFIPKEVMARAKCSVADILREQGSRSGSEKASSSTRVLAGSQGPRTQSSEFFSMPVSPSKMQDAVFRTAVPDCTAAVVEDAQLDKDTKAENEEPQPRKRKIFDNLVIYVNGSTHPIISDHKLKHLLAENGARMSFHLGRRQVTHVILGRPAAVGHGAGGGLAGGKLEKEIRRVGGCGIKYVGVEWVLESIKAGKRLPEGRFANLKVASKGQQSVYGAFTGAKSADSALSQGQAPPS